MILKDSNREIGVIGGIGIYDIDGMDWVNLSTHLGDPSDQLLIGGLNGQKIFFLPRHRRGHKITPSEINYPANRFAFKSRGGLLATKK